MPEDTAQVCVTDFDPADVDYAGWRERFPDLQKQCPVFKSTGQNGYWVAAGYPELTEMMRDWETFSSAKHWEKEGDVPTGGNVVPPVPARAFIPVETDPPKWKKYRFLLNPFFAPKAAKSYTGVVTEVATALIDRVIEKGEVDITRDFTNPLTALSTLRILGINYSEDEWRRWSLPFHQLAYARGTEEFGQCLADLEWIRQQLSAAVDLNWAEQQPGLFGTLCHANTAEGKLSKQELIDIGMMVLVGGVGTTTALFSNTMIYLSQDLEARQRLIDEPELLDKAKEEFVRYFSPINSQARTVTHDTEVCGASMKAGEQVLMALGAANRDERVFPDADTVILDRMPNPHVGFGAGIHRCLGSFLARVFFEVMFREVMTRMPDIMVDEARVRRFPSATSVNGLISVPATFTPGHKVGSGALA
ncbi:cytochrome P450 [Novosphingobium sp. KCTC 2891]|uniref:cytochrome P450 n=1 Tax=Novosphingobium sp. KCTC 2891 TaxID=2989730 RepID=UPI002223BDD7|nr:cytochrome P450 [Novosphingobium sp. KCTC 2891]MCW1384890.1 cytochrome P450 [Novosphingobium sp. KCTC 2891]